MIADKNKKLIKRLCLIPIILVYAAILFKSAGTGPIDWSVFLRKIELFTLIFAFAALHCFVEIKKLYDFIYKYRVWLCIGLLAFSVLNNFNGSSIGMWNSYIEPNSPVSLGNPIFGNPLPIRSDEWAVNIPRMMSGEYSNYTEFNDIVRGVRTENISASGLFRDYSALYNPSRWGYYMFDFSHGLSFQWSYLLIFGFLFSFELCNVLTGNKPLSLLGASLLWFSPFNIWWSIIMQMVSLSAIPVLFYYALTAHNRIKRALFAFMLAIAGADFVCNLYPAWQVPAGWIMLSLMIYIVVTNTDWKKYKLPDWLIVIAAVVFMVSIIVRFLYVDMSYINAVSATVYPGARVDYGADSISKLLGYPATFLTGLIRTDVFPNNCEAASFFGVFPVAYVLIPYGIVASRKNLDSPKKPSVLWFLLVPLAILTAYCTIGLPPIVAKLLLMDKSTSFRAIDYLGALLVIILIVSLSEIRKNGGLKLVEAIAISVLSVIPAINYSKGILLDNSGKLIEITAVFFVVSMTLMLSKIKSYKWDLSVVSTAVILACGALAIHPLMVGTSAVTDKPAATEIQELVEENPDAKWVSTNFIYSQFLIANGAPTVTSTNYIPNMELWEEFDPDGSDEEIYNRYAHLNLALIDDGESYYELVQADMINLVVTKDDFDKLDADFLVTVAPIDEYWSEDFELEYQGENILIYRLNKTN